jgi:uncharacterized phage protein (predicted DNA packaging)
MTISEVTFEKVKAYLRADDYTEDDQLIRDIMSAAKYTIALQIGQSVEDTCNLPALGIAFEMLVNDLYENRTANLEHSKYAAMQMNPVYNSIIGMHRENLL